MFDCVWFPMISIKSSVSKLGDAGGLLAGSRGDGGGAGESGLVSGGGGGGDAGSGG